LLSGAAEALEPFPIDHDVSVAPWSGGMDAASEQLRSFDIGRYAELRNEPEQDATSGLSPYLHFGHISTHEVMATVFEREGWSIDRLGWKTDGKRRGWWGMSEAAEAFVDELVTWRELGFHFCFHRDDYASYDSLPPWAKRTLDEHADDPRDELYSLEQFERAETSDPLWNAAQNQLVREGRIHNYLRMLWGKKILQWSATPQQALEVMVELNNKYALDGRDPNSYSGIFWVLGRFDRAWGPERSVFGKIRYMTSANTARKVSVKGYIARYAGHQSAG
jgi:deoxyribodipyrimidine photo-lyase